jgi:DNA repair protein RadC
MELRELQTDYSQPIIIRNPSDIVEQMSDIRKWTKEAAVVFFLDTKGDVTGREIISIGTLNTSLIHPREVFRNAVIKNASRIILAHNHPSGSVEPSQEDREITKRIKESGEIIDIPLIDHVIVTERFHYSFHNNGEV